MPDASSPTDPIDVLFVYDRWATRNLLDACAALSDKQLHQEFAMGTGSLHNNLTHILGAMRGWTDVLTRRDEPRPRLEGTNRTIAELRDLHEEIADEFEAAVRAHPFDEILTPSRGGRTFEFPRGGIFPHVMTHSMHHRAQCLNMLRQLEVETLPPSSVVEWMIMGGGEA